jgi:hypothetical protein
MRCRLAPANQQLLQPAIVELQPSLELQPLGQVSTPGGAPQLEAGSQLTSQAHDCSQPSGLPHELIPVQAIEQAPT